MVANGGSLCVDIQQADFTRFCLPLYHRVFEFVAPDFRLLQLLVDAEGADKVLRATVAWRHYVVVGQHVIEPNPMGTANASTLLGHALLAPMLAIALVVAWPNSSQQRWVPHVLLRLLMLAPLLALLVAIDLPVVLAGELWHMVLFNLSPDGFSPLVLWRNFMQGGGRYALGLCAGAVAVAVAQRLAARHHAHLACKEC